MKDSKYHNNFQLNGNSFATAKEILDYVKPISAAVHLFLTAWFSKEKTIAVQTSGSTGEPKLIVLKKEFMLNSALATGNFFDLPEKTTALLCLPTHYIAGKMMLIRALTLGWHLDMVPPNSFPLKAVEKHYDFSAMVPLQLQNSLDKLHLINKLIVGGGVVSSVLQEKISALETTIFATYGMTETITHIAIKKLNNCSAISFYKLLPGVEIYKDIRNCLVINAPKISDEILFTNDVVQLISETEFKWLGRFDNVINSGGIKLHPEKIEAQLALVIKERFFVAGIPDPILGDKLILVVERKEKPSISNSLHTEHDQSSLSSKIKNLGLLSNYEIPKEIYFIDKFVETETKKIQRKKTLLKIVH